MITFKQILKSISEELEPHEKLDVDKWEKTDPKAREATDHYFGKDVDTKHIPLEDTVDKSEIHRKVEKHLGHTISPDSYKSGKTEDEHGREVRIGKLLQKTKAPDEIKRNFENDSTRQAKSAGGLTVKISRHAHDVAGQTSKGHSWEEQSCKNYKTGCNKQYLPREVKHGTVVSYLHDHNGKEIARKTLQPYLNDKGHTAYGVDSSYGINHEGFNKATEKAAKDLSGEHKGGSFMYHIHNNVYNDSDAKLVHPNLTPEHIHKVLDSDDNNEKEAILHHSNITKEHIDKAIKSPDSEVVSTAIIHKNATPEQINKVLDHKVDYTRVNAIRNKNANSDNISKAMKDPSHMVRMQAALNKNATDEHHKYILSHDNEDVRAASAKRVSDPHIIDKTISDPSEFVAQRLTENPHLTPKHIDKLLDHRNLNVRCGAIMHPNSSVDNISKGLLDANHTVRRMSLEHLNANDEHVEKGLSDEDGNVRRTAVRLKDYKDSQKKLRESIKDKIQSKLYELG